MIGKVVKDGNEIILNDDYRWESETLPAFAQQLNEIVEIDDSSQAGIAGHAELRKLAADIKGRLVLTRKPQPKGRIDF